MRTLIVAVDENREAARSSRVRMLGAQLDTRIVPSERVIAALSVPQMPRHLERMLTMVWPT